MVLILSENFDQSTNEVIDWLVYQKKNFVRLNYEDLKICKIEIKTDGLSISFNHNGKDYSVNEFDSVWYRKGDFVYELNLEFDASDKLQSRILKHLTGEWQSILDFFFFNIERKKCLGSYNAQNTSKLIILLLAREIGFKIPESFVITKKSDICLFYEAHNANIITKGVQNSPSLTFENISLDAYTEVLDDITINGLSKDFFPSLVQNNIKKKIELRIFVIRNDFYSMAIFSQDTEQTKTDYRKYSKQEPNRTVPYQLPDDIKEKILKLMEKIGLNCCSFDMIVDDLDNYIFLEVNPSGQFMMVSQPCNYYLEKKISLDLV